MESDNFEVKSLWNSVYIMLSVINVITNIGFSMIMTTISMYAVSLGASLTVAGMVASILSFAALMVRPISGIFFDRLNKKMVLIVSTVIYGIIIFGYACVKDIPLLFIIRILHGITFSISGTAAMALVSRFIPKNRKSEGLGYFNAGVLVGQAFGPTIAVCIKDIIGFPSLYVIIALSTCLPPLMCLFIKMPYSVIAPSPAVKVGSGPRFSVKDFIAKQFLLYAMVCGTFSFYSGVTNAFILLIGEERRIDGIGLFFTVSSVVLLAVRIFTGKMSDRKSLSALVNISLLLTAVSMLFAGFAEGLLLIIASAVFKAVGQGIGQVSLQGEVFKKADAAHIGVVTSTMFIGNDIGNALGPIVGGFVSELTSYATMFFLSIILIAAALVAFTAYQKKIGYKKPIPEELQS